MAREIANLTSVASQPVSSPDITTIGSSTTAVPSVSLQNTAIVQAPMSVQTSPMMVGPSYSGGGDRQAISGGSVLVESTWQSSSLAGVVETTSDLLNDAEAVFLGASLPNDSSPSRGQAGVLQPAGQPTSLVKFTKGSFSSTLGGGASAPAPGGRICFGPAVDKCLENCDTNSEIMRRLCCGGIANDQDRRECEAVYNQQNSRANEECRASCRKCIAVIGNPYKCPVNDPIVFK